MSDNVNNPKHYTSHPSGIECLTIVRHMGFNLGNAVKYIWRASLKGKEIEDLEKAVFYLKDEILQLKRSGAQPKEEITMQEWLVADRKRRACEIDAAISEVTEDTIAAPSKNFIRSDDPRYGALFEDCNCFLCKRARSG